MKDSISLCVFVYNDLPILKATLMHEVRWVDQICILDLASTDGTQEFCEAFLRPGIDVYERREENTCSKRGFAEAKNAVMNLSCKEWSICGGANTVLDWRHMPFIRQALGRTTSDVISINTVNIKPYQTCSPHLIERAIKFGEVDSVHQHRVILRNGAGLDYKGYIHEEPYRGEVNCIVEAEKLTFQRYHFQGWGNDELRGWRYAWMLDNAVQNPDLQKYTNRWWYDVYYPNHLELMKSRAKKYEEYMATTGKR